MYKTALFSLGIADLGFSYLLFTSQQYFSSIAMLSVLFLAVISFSAFMVAHVRKLEGRKGRRTFFTLLGISLVIVLYNISFTLINPLQIGTILKSIGLTVGGTTLTIVLVYFWSKYTKDFTGAEQQIAILLGALVIAALAYISLYAFSNINWNGVDELAFNYYGAYVLVHGMNPYVVSMEPILQQRGIFPTILQNGTYDFFYPYPALSFLAYLPLIFLGISNFFSFIAIIIFLAIFTAMHAYRASGLKREMLVPLGAWIAVSYALIGVPNPYLAITTFAFFAYMLRHRPAISGILLGLAASTTQLAWFALPFFYTMYFLDHGRRSLVQSIATSATVFILVNAYFVLSAPSATLHNIFGILGLSQLPFYGTNIMELLLAFYPVPYWYSAVIPLMIIFSALALFFVYNKTLHPLIAIVSIFIFFLSWRNISIYGTSFVPILLLIYYGAHERREKDLFVSRKPIIYVSIALVIAILLITIVAHGSYSSANLLQIRSVVPIIFVLSNGNFALGGLNISVTNNMNAQVPISYYIISRAPNNEEYALGYQLQPLAPLSTGSYPISYQLPRINNNTKLFVFAFNQHYITSRAINISIRAPPNFNLTTTANQTVNKTAGKTPSK